MSVNLTPWSFEGTKVDGLIGSTPVYRRGETVDVSWLFVPADGGGDTEHIDRYQSVKQYLQASGKYALSETNEHEPRFELQLSGEEDVGTCLVKVGPKNAVRYVDEFWALIESGEDQTTQPKKRCVLEMSLLMIARTSEYGTRGGVVEQFSPSFV